MTAVRTFLILALLPGVVGQRGEPPPTFKVSGRLIGVGNLVSLVPSAIANQSGAGCGLMSRSVNWSPLASDKTYEMRVSPGEYALCVGSRGLDTLAALAGPFSVTVSDRDLVLDINSSQEIFSAPGVVTARGAIRPINRPGATAAEAARAVAGVTLSGRVLISVPAQSTAMFGSAHLISREAPGAPVRQIATTRVVLQSPTDGGFEFWYVPPGSYDLLVGLGGMPSGPGGGSQWIALGRTSVDLRQDLHNVVVTLSPGVDVTGFVTLDGRPASPSGLRISLKPDPAAAAVTRFPAQVSRLLPAIAADGTFVIRGVFEGSYSIDVTSAQTNISVVEIRQGGVAIRGAGLRVGSLPASKIEIVLSSSNGR